MGFGGVAANAVTSFQSTNAVAAKEFSEELHKLLEKGGQGAVEKEAVSWEPEKQWRLGWAYKNGYPVNNDQERAVKWWSIAAGRGYASAQFNFGMAYFFGSGIGENKQHAITWLKQSAKQGNASAQYNLGFAYQNGDGVKCDNSEALYWFKLAADQGNLVALHAMGEAYWRGRGVDQNLSEAVKWFQKAAMGRHMESEYSLGLIYWNGGNGLERDPNEALAWMFRADGLGMVAAQSMMAGISQEKISAAKKRAQELKVKRKADLRAAINDANKSGGYKVSELREPCERMAVTEDSSSTNSAKVGAINANGYTEDQAVKYRDLLLRANGGDARAQYEVACCCALGYGVTLDKVEAIKWFRKTVNAKDSHSASRGMNNLGMAYFNGSGVPIDPARAMYWLRKAVLRGDSAAAWNLGMKYSLSRQDTMPSDPMLGMAWIYLSGQKLQSYKNIVDCMENKLGPDQVARAKMIAASLPWNRTLNDNKAQ
jgi:TPR repeat protein